MGNITIRELAQQLGLSIATVSKALKDSYEISDATKKKIVSLANELNYSPNPYASSLRKQQSKTIAVVLPEVADSFFSLAINGIQEVALAKGYHVLFYLSHESFELEKKAISHCNNGRVDGILISVSSETRDTAHISSLRSKNIPVVFFDRELEDYKAPKVVTNDYECGELAARHLLDKGCRFPVFLSTSDALAICQNRFSGFANEIGRIQNEIAACPFIINCSNDRNTYDQIASILEKFPAIDGIVASVEKLAIQTLLVCADQNIPIPGRLKVLAFSTLETAPLLNPSLTTISQPAFDIGKHSAETLITMIEKKKHSITDDYKAVLPSLLNIRKSTQ